MNVELYSKPGCHLCDEARAVLQRVRQDIPFEFFEINIERDEALMTRYKNDIPVVFVDGVLFFKHKIDEEALRKRLERSRSFAMGTLDPRKTLSRTRPVGRGTKIAFAILTVLMFSSVAAGKVYQVYFEPEKTALASIDVQRLDLEAPDATFVDATGKQLRLADFKGKTVFVNFWATWCPPCREEMPSMGQLARKLQTDPNFVMLAVSVDQDWDEVHKFFGEDKPSFTVVRDPNEVFAKKIGTTKYPETYVIGPDGRIKAKFVGPRDWSEKALHLFFRRILDGKRV